MLRHKLQTQPEQRPKGEGSLADGLCASTARNATARTPCTFRNLRTPGLMMRMMSWPRMPSQPHRQAVVACRHRRMCLLRQLFQQSLMLRSGCRPPHWPQCLHLRPTRRDPPRAPEAQTYASSHCGICSATSCRMRPERMSACTSHSSCRWLRLDLVAARCHKSHQRCLWPPRPLTMLSCQECPHLSFRQDLLQSPQRQSL
mmetsp:Transcript_17993/g.49648  ORF Transcript_17993/g.49648 Transcript_17993/m.49648 type:complete len:201 (+) Transcript_17993:1139-1741(+)